MRALIIGMVFCFIIGTADIYNLVKIQGSYMTIDFTTGFAIFFIFFITLFNYLFKKIFKKRGLTISELFIIYIMMIVSCAIPTMGLTLYLIPLISGIKYYSNPQNEWETLILPHIKKNLIVVDENAIKWFFEGLPKGEKIPWASWVKPLSLWIPLILVIYLAMVFIMVIIHKQWSENERLNYPMTKGPVELINSDTTNIFKNWLFWIGFLIPFIFGIINGLHFYFPAVPQAQLVKNIPIFRRTLSLSFRISFPMIGFTYFVSLPLSFSLWFFCLLTTIEQGFFNITGFGTQEFLPYNADRPLLGWQSLGSLIVIVLYGLWISRKNLLRIIKAKEGNEIISPKTASIGMIICFLFIYFWLLYSGLSPLPSILFIFFAFLIYIGITRVICEGGLAATRAPVISPVIVNSFLGSSRLGASNLCGLGLTFVYASDVRTFVMASVANGLKMIEEMKEQKMIVFWAIIISILITLFSSIWATIILCYKYGGINANTWFFVSGPQYPLRYVADKIKNPKGPDWLYIGFTGIGALLTIFLLIFRIKLLNFPFHPLGFAFSTIMMTNALWFSIFISWLLKSFVLRYGGAKIYEKLKPLFIGLIIGQFVISGLFLIVDFLTNKTGNTIFWA
ncbi:MAG: hypothetical protein NC915_03330 [Candidatus Omnitrophica bacterium]|nr:hypothetical protein [Candidatus Omnitrophota bacterium]